MSRFPGVDWIFSSPVVQRGRGEGEGGVGAFLLLTNQGVITPFNRDLKHVRTGALWILNLKS